jgi:hypothetical protein
METRAARNYINVDDFEFINPNKATIGYPLDQGWKTATTRTIVKPMVQPTLKLHQPSKRFEDKIRRQDFQRQDNSQIGK